MLTQLLEKLKRPGLLGLIGRKVEKRCEKDLHAYFTALGRRIVGLELETLAEQTTPELARHTAELKVSNVLRTFSPLLKGVLEVNIHDAMLAANRIHHLAETDDEGDDPGNDTGTINSGFSMTSEEASLYASVRAGELVRGINATTQTKIADAVAEGITDRLGVDGTKRLIRATVDDMTALRARMIASTEMNTAFSEATLRKLDRLGVEWKQWITAGACCDLCAENEDASPIPVDELFPSGDQRPPGHVNCRCAVTGARAPAA